MWQCVVLCFVFLVCGGLCRTLDSDYSDENTLKIVDLDQLSPSDDSSSRIVGGVTASIESYNYTVQLLRNNQLSCGGSLLTLRSVLTSAHCFFDGNGVRIRDRDFSVRAGSSYLDTGGTVVQVRSVILHPQYNTPERDSDIAVVVLRRAFTRSRSIDQAGIPRQWQIVPDGQTVVHVGWGFTDPLRPVVSNVLQQVQVYTINREICRSNYARLQLQVTNNMICAGVLGVGGRDACRGDSGGPLLWRGAVVGVTSWGYGCGHPDYPGVSAYVPHYTDWIIRTVEANGTSPRIASVILLIASAISALLVK